MTILSYIITIFFVTLIYKIIKFFIENRKLAKYVDKLPGPKKVPLFGNALQLNVPRQRK